MFTTLTSDHVVLLQKHPCSPAVFKTIIDMSAVVLHPFAVGVFLLVSSTEQLYTLFSADCAMSTFSVTTVTPVPWPNCHKVWHLCTTIQNGNVNAEAVTHHTVSSLAESHG